MNPGFVYILTNDSMPGLVKIGRTSRDVDLRASELWQTGVPTKFDVFAKERTCDCVQLEAYIHGDFRKQRVNRSREFFAVDPDMAAARLKMWAGIQAHEMISENFSGFASVPFKALVDEESIERLAKESGQPERVIAEAIGFLTVEELFPAIDRALSRRKNEEREMLASLGLLDDGGAA